MSTNVAVWVEVFFTLAIFSMIFKDNPIYRFAEHLFVGLAAGHAIVMGVNTLRNTAWNPAVQQGKAVMFVPLILGLLLYTRYFKSVAWLSRYPVVLMLVVGSALGMRGAVQAQFLDQIVATFKALTSLDAVIILVGVIGTLTFFFFTGSYTRLLKGPLAWLPQIGRTTMMIAFGASFGNAVMGRMVLLIARVKFLMADWLGLIK